jgi:hypothetical protein
MVWMQCGCCKATDFILDKQEQQQQDVYNTEREAVRLLKMQPQDPDKASHLLSCNSLSSRLAYRRLLTMSGLSVVRGPQATITMSSSNDVDIHLKLENMTDTAK